MRGQAAVAVPAALGHVCPWQDCIAVTSPIGQCDTGSTQHSCSHREGILVARRTCSLPRTAGTVDPGSGLVNPDQQLLPATRGIHCNASHGLFLSRAELLAIGGIASLALGRWIRCCPPSGAATNRRDQSHPERAGRPS